MVYWTYNVVLTLVLILLAPVLPLLLLLRVRWMDGLRDRLAWYSADVQGAVRGARPVWVHAVSVGEVRSGQCLAEALRRTYPERKILISSSTATGIEMARKIAAANTVIFFPWDHPWIVSRAFRVLDPALLIVLETEIWPSFLRMAHRRGIPVLLLSGRISERSLRRYQRWGSLFRQVVRQFNALGMQTEGDGQRMAQVGAEPSKIWITGNLKFGADGPLNGKQAKILLPQNPTKRNFWVAGSTHRGEEVIVLDAHDNLKLRFPGLGLVLAPRHPQRFLEVEALLQKRGLVYAKRSQTNGQNSWTADVLLLDTMGELADFYVQAAGAFVGGSLVEVGGHNILEPARLRKPVFFGPFMDNFSVAAAEMEQNRGAVVVRTRDDLVRELSRVLADPVVAQEMGELAHRVVAKHQEVVARSMDLVSRYLS
jgi:3-deoxy-D-manno-octulosonic-acid transferase